MKKRRTAQSAFLSLCVLIGLVVFFVGLLLATFATANLQTSIRALTRNLDGAGLPRACHANPDRDSLRFGRRLDRAGSLSHRCLGKRRVLTRRQRL